jgi:hypothetical protein
MLGEHPLPIRQRLLIQRDRAAEVPRRLVGAGRLFRDVSVSRWSPRRLVPPRVA